MDKHYHCWSFPDDGSVNGNRSVMFRCSHPFASRQAARVHGMKEHAFFATVLACEDEHNHVCGVGGRNGKNGTHTCPDATMIRGGGRKAKAEV